MVRHRRRQLAACATAAAIVGLAVLGWTLSGSSPAAAAMPTEQGYCSAAQVDARMDDVDQGASVVHAAVEFTARPGQSCRLTGAPPAMLQGAGDVPVQRDQAGTGDVLIDGTHAAHVALSWPVAGTPAQQRTPRSLSLEMPGVRADHVIVAWRAGRIDGPAARGHLSVGAVAAGLAPRS